MKLFLITLLFIAIPLQGFARVIETEKACPTQHSTNVASANASSAHSCCKEAKAQSTNSSACKTVQDCQPSGLGMIVQIATLHSHDSDIEQSPSPSSLKLSFTPPATWRPPAQL